MSRLSLKELGKTLILSFDELKRNDPLRLAGATAFFTTFALPPILIILVQIIGLVFQIRDLRDRFFVHLAALLGGPSALQVRETFFGFKSLAKNWVVAIGGFIFLLFVATTLFKVIKDSLNQLWNVKMNEGTSFTLQLKSRLVSLIVILFAGVLFIGSMLAEGLDAFLHQYTGELEIKQVDLLPILFNQAISVVMVSLWFAVLFKALPDAKLSRNVATAGGFFTGILFSIGKVVIHALLVAGNLNSIFGASSSIVLLLLFVFYCSFILYYGACFTKMYAVSTGQPIEPSHHAMKYKLVSVEGE